MTWRTASASETTSWPSTRAVPDEGARNVARMRNVVVFPAPLEPMNPNKSPRFTVRSSELSAVIAPYERVRPMVCIAGNGGADSAAFIKLISARNGNRDAPEGVLVAAARTELVQRFNRRMIRLPREQHGIILVQQ